MSMSPTDERHGTYAGRLAHRAAGEQPCGPCREAYNVYQRSVRAKPGHAERERQANNASSRAVWRLVELHREEYERIRAEELLAIRQASA